ncbi:MAG TPA: T9SS type A sorting domain-containing protein [bacterium]|jgi:hypothetical protein
MKNLLGCIGGLAMLVSLGWGQYNPDTLWTRTWTAGAGGAEFFSLHGRADGGFLMGGKKWESDNRLYGYMARLDAQGILLWSHDYGDGTQSFSGFAAGQSGRYYFCGNSAFSDSGRGIRVDEVDTTGAILNSRVYRDPAGDLTSHDLAATADGGLVLGGTAEDWDSSGIILMKVDSVGSITWRQLYFEADYQSLAAVIQTRDGGYAIVGTAAYADRMQSQLLVIRFERDGRLMWTRAIGYEGPEGGYGIVQTADGGFYVTGTSNDVNYTQQGTLVARLDSHGELLWMRVWRAPHPQTSYGYSVALTPDSGCVVSGYYESMYPDYPCGLLLRYSAQGDLVLAETYTAGVGTAQFYGISVMPDSSYALAGTFWPSTGGNRMWLARMAHERLMLRHPAGHDVLLVDSVYALQWDALPRGGTVTIELDRDFPSGTWEPVAAATANDGEFTWNVTVPETEHGRFRVRHDQDTTQADTVTADIIITHPRLAIRSPQAGDTVWSGNLDTVFVDRYFIPDDLHIEVNHDYPTGPWDTLIVTSSLDWIPWSVTQPASNHCRIRLTSATRPEIMAETNGDFVIMPTPITVSTPSGGEVFHVGQHRVVMWDAPRLDGNVAVLLNSNYPSGTWMTVGPNRPNDGRVAWTIPNVNSTHCRIRVIAVRDRLTYGESAADFTITDALDADPDLLPRDFSFDAPYPNPFNALTTMKLELPTATPVNLYVCDVTGRVVRTLVHGMMEPGSHSLVFDGSGLASGLYFARLESPALTRTQKLLLLK